MLAKTVTAKRAVYCNVVQRLIWTYGMGKLEYWPCSPCEMRYGWAQMLLPSAVVDSSWQLRSPCQSCRRGMSFQASLYYSCLTFPSPPTMPIKTPIRVDTLASVLLKYWARTQANTEFVPLFLYDMWDVAYLVCSFRLKWQKNNINFVSVVLEKGGNDDRSKSILYMYSKTHWDMYIVSLAEIYLLKNLYCVLKHLG